jgi:type II secretion system protein H
MDQGNHHGRQASKVAAVLTLNRPRVLPSRTRRSGLSLIELTVVSLLVGIIAVIGSLRYADALSRHRVRRSAERIAAELQAARHTARARGQVVTISFNAVNQSFTVTGIANPDHPSAAYTKSLADGSLSAAITAVNFGGDAVIQFNTFGVPDSGGSLTLSSGTATQIVAVTAGTGAVTLP